MKKTKTIINYLIFAFRVISVFIIIMCVYVLYWWYTDNQKNSSLKEKYSEYILTKDQNKDLNNPDNPFTPKYTTATDINGVSIEAFGVDFNALFEQNSDCVGWVRVLDTSIDFPIVQTTDNDYYLTHNIELEENGAGWIYADYRNNFITLDRNTIIYGHNRRNGTMFSNLQYYLDDNFCSNPNHRYFNFNTKQGRFLAEVFSAYKVSTDDVELYNEFSDEEFQETLNNWKAKSEYNFNTEVKPTDKILSLFTCDDDTDYRILLHSKLIRLQ